MFNLLINDDKLINNDLHNRLISNISNIDEISDIDMTSDEVKIDDIIAMFAKIDVMITTTLVAIVAKATKAAKAAKVAKAERIFLNQKNL